MASSSLAIVATLFAVATVFLISPSQSQPATCTSQTLPTNNNLYTLCSDLPTLDAYLHWAYDRARSTLSVAFVARAEPRGWISWAINPTGTGMGGSQALVAFRDSRGEMTVRTYNITGYGPVTESRIRYEVRNTSAIYTAATGVMTLFAIVALPDATALNHVWQVGPSVTRDVPDRHAFQPANMNAKGRLDLLSGQSTGGVTGGGSRTRNRNIHGVLNVVSWGIMFPTGIIIARYLRVFPSADPAWFYLHIFCQVSAYAIGVAGWGTGLKLGSESSGITYSVHRNIGISLFTLATVQIFALLLRPKKDHKIRFYWNIYHHAVGYAILILAIINVFKGFGILQPGHKWKNAYIVVISILGGIAVFLEAITWVVVIRRKKHDQSTKPYDGFTN